MNLMNKIDFWIFDMDGTLTVPIHDFKAIRDELGLPHDEDILANINKRPREEAEKLHSELAHIEYELAMKTEAQPGIHHFLSQLQKEEKHLGIITRNNKKNTLATLKASGLDTFFHPEEILTREFERPKPHPDPVLWFLKRWQAPTDKTIIIGDYRHDIEAGDAAGIHTLYFDSKKSGEWNHMTKLCAQSWSEVESLASQRA